MSTPSQTNSSLSPAPLSLPLVVATALLVVGCARESAPPPQMAAPIMARNAGGVPSFQYRLPIVGPWRVFRTHYGATNDQAYALDLVVDSAPQSGMQMRRGGQRSNASYPSYGQPIVADGPGVIVIAADGVPDNVPGVMNRYDMHGNFVVIDHENGEYSLMAHLVPGSLKVRVGQRVVAGTVLGSCGNSGNSSEPHLHWQVMDNANAHQARGIAPRLLPYERNGSQTVELPQGGDNLVGP